MPAPSPAAAIVTPCTRDEADLRRHPCWHDPAERRHGVADRLRRASPHQGLTGMFGGFLHGYGRRGIGHRRGRCRKSRPARVRPAPARLGLPVKRLTFVAIVIAEAFGILAGRRGFALRFAGEAAVAAAVAVLEAVVDAGRPRRCRRGSVDRHQRHARNRNRRSQPVDSAQFHSPLVRPPSTYLGGGLSNSIIIFVSPTSAVARRARQRGQRRSPIFLARGFPRDDWFDAGEREEGAGQSR